MPKLTVAQIDRIALDAGFLLNEVRATAVAIAMAESGGETTATHRNTNGSTDYGLWQINSVHAALLRTGSWSNPTDNGRMAHQIYADAGNSFHPWSTYNNGSYLAFLSVARRTALSGGTGSAKVNATSEQGSATANAVPSGLPVPSPLTPLAGLVDLARLLTSPATWLRASMLLAGVVILWWGIRALSEIDNKAAAAVVKTGMAAATDGASVAASKAVRGVVK